MKTFKDVYEKPFIVDKFSRVKDSKGNFIFQFIVDLEDKVDLIISVINEEATLKNIERDVFTFDRGVVKYGDLGIILIRGWGNLTGIGGMNLSTEEAENIQNTLGWHIVKMLNRI